MPARLRLMLRVQRKRFVIMCTCCFCLHSSRLFSTTVCGCVCIEWHLTISKMSLTHDTTIAHISSEKMKELKERIQTQAIFSTKKCFIFHSKKLLDLNKLTPKSQNWLLQLRINWVHELCSWLTIGVSRVHVLVLSAYSVCMEFSIRTLLFCSSVLGLSKY